MKQLRCANPQKSERTKVWGFSVCVDFQKLINASRHIFFSVFGRVQSTVKINIRLSWIN